MEDVWNAIGKLTYAEMLELAGTLVDAADASDVSIDCSRNEVADLIECARQSYMEHTE